MLTVLDNRFVNISKYLLLFFALAVAVSISALFLGDRTSTSATPSAQTAQTVALSNGASEGQQITEDLDLSFDDPNPASTFDAVNGPETPVQSVKIDESKNKDLSQSNVKFSYVPTPAPSQLPTSSVAPAQNLGRVAGASASSGTGGEISPTPAAEEIYLSVEPAEPILANLAPAGAQIVMFANVYMTAVGADVIVKRVQIERLGLANDAVFSAVGILDNGNGVGIALALRGDHTYNTNAPFTIKKGETHQVTLYGSMAFDLSSYKGQLPALALKEVEASVPVRATLPIVGTMHIVNSSLTIGTLTAESNGQYDPGVNRRYYINTDKNLFSGFKLTAGRQEPIFLKQVVWRQNGTAGIDDVSKVETIVVRGNSETAFPTPLTDPAKRVYTADLGNDMKIDKGETVQIYVRGTVGVGYDRTVVFDIDDYPDILGIGASYGYYILALGGDTTEAAASGQFSTALHPFYHGYVHTISAGGFGASK